MIRMEWRGWRSREISKIENGKIELEQIPFSILDCAENALQPVTVRAQQKGLGLEWYVRGELPEWVEGDPTRLRQVLINLVSKYAPKDEQEQPKPDHTPGEPAAS